MPEIKLDQVNIVVGDMEASASFYGMLGLEVSDGGMPEWAPHHRGGRAGGVDVDLDSEVFAAQWDQGWPGGPGVLLCFKVATRDDVDQLYERLTSAGHTGQQAPYDAFWGARFAIVSDPDGNAVGLMSPADEAHRNPGPPAPG